MLKVKALYAHTTLVIGNHFNFRVTVRLAKKYFYFIFRFNIKYRNKKKTVGIIANFSTCYDYYQFALENGLSKQNRKGKFQTFLVNLWATTKIASSNPHSPQNIIPWHVLWHIEICIEATNKLISSDKNVRVHCNTTTVSESIDEIGLENK